MGSLGALREILGNLKRRKPSKKYCPKCGSPNLHLSSKFDVWILPEQYVCGSCGYRSSIAIEAKDS